MHVKVACFGEGYSEPLYLPFDSSHPHSSLGLCCSKKSLVCVIRKIPGCRRDSHRWKGMSYSSSQTWLLAAHEPMPGFSAAAWWGRHATSLTATPSCPHGTTSVPLRKEESLPYSKNQLIFCFSWMEEGQSLLRVKSPTYFCRVHTGWTLLPERECFSPLRLL